MIRPLFITVLISILSLTCIGQIGVAEQPVNPRHESIQAHQGGQKNGAVRYHMDQRITRLDSLKKLNPTQVEGYRVQIFFGDRNEAQAKRVEFLRMYPEVGAYVSYLAPNFRLRVGDFRTRLESEKFKTEISQKYPGTYIVKDRIEFTPIGAEAQEGITNR